MTETVERFSIIDYPFSKAKGEGMLEKRLSVAIVSGPIGKTPNDVTHFGVSHRESWVTRSSRRFQ